MIPLPLKPKVIKKEGNKAVFEIEALYPGYGVTIGNCLRRVLLSSLEGAAVSQVRIKGVSREFTTIPGLAEDVVLLMLNLKQLRFKMFGSEPQRATLKVKGAKEVKGADFKTSGQVELANPNCHIATLTARTAELEMEILIEKGIGYLPREARKREAGSAKGKLEIGVIPLDAIFTPVKRVGFKVENMRVGERTDFDRLFLEIETDGTLTPEQAFSESSEILVKHFSLLEEAFRKREEISPAKQSPGAKVKVKKHAKAKKRKKT